MSSMSKRNFTEADVHPWRVVNNLGKTLNYPLSHDKAGKPMNDFKGYKDAIRLAPAGATAVRA
jgi:hypothetical protein